MKIPKIAIASCIVTCVLMGISSTSFAKTNIVYSGSYVTEEDYKEMYDDTYGNASWNIFSELNDEERSLVFWNPFDAIAVRSAKKTAENEMNERFVIRKQGIVKKDGKLVPGIILFDRNGKKFNSMEEIINVIHNGEGDAFRHAYWNALMSKKIGVSMAAKFANAHEAGNDNPTREKKMDLANNATGRLIFKNNRDASSSELADLVFDALKSGDLEVINQ